MRRLLNAAEEFEPRGVLVAASRSLLSFAELTVLLSNSDRLLFGIAPYAPTRELCSGVGGLSLWCVTGVGPQSHSAGRIIAIVILTGVIAGICPRWLCIPHWYVAFSLATRMSAVNGGEEAAQIFTLLLIPFFLGDTRTWHWQQSDRPLPPAWRGSSYAAQLTLRCQIIIIYVDAALSKLMFPSWQQGTAVRTIFHDPECGLPMGLRAIADRLLGPIWISAAVTWSVVLMELCIGVSMMFRVRIRRRGLALAIILHMAIILAMGLFSFGLIMISILMAVCGTGSQEGARGRGPTVIPPGAGSRSTVQGTIART